MKTGLQAEQFTATAKALASYAGRNCTDPQDIRIAIDHHNDVAIPIPATKTDLNKEVAKVILGKEIGA